MGDHADKCHLVCNYCYPLSGVVERQFLGMIFMPSLLSRAWEWRGWGAWQVHERDHHTEHFKGQAASDVLQAACSGGRQQQAQPHCRPARLPDLQSA